MSTDLMIDIETLGTGGNSHVLSIGLVWFDINHPDESLIELPIIYPVMDQPRSQIDGETVQWWMKQGVEAKEVFAYALERDSLSDAAAEVANAVDKASRVWAKDPDFDCVILDNFVRNYLNKGIKWPFWKNRSVRTMLDVYPQAKQLPFEGVEHNALADAVHQAKQMQSVFTYLKSRFK